MVLNYKVKMKKCKGEMVVKMISALGSVLGEMCMPKKMKEHLIKAYVDSGVIRTTYLFIDGTEITDGINYNPFYHIG
jgi:hypothetical protein